MILSAEYCGTQFEQRPRFQLRGRSVAFDLALVVVIAFICDGRLEWVPNIDESIKSLTGAARVRSSRIPSLLDALDGLGFCLSCVNDGLKNVDED